MVGGSTWFWPPFGFSTRVLRLSLERWADESAAGEDVSSRSRLASGLFDMAVEAPRPALAAFFAPDGLVERAPMGEPARGKLPMLWWLVLFVPDGLLGAASLYGVTRLGGSAYCLVSKPSRCPILSLLR